jgi:RNA binding exosome subunit
VVTLPQIPVAYIDIEFFAHATEDLEKVMKAVRNILPANRVGEIEFEKNNLKGHHGNPIVFFEAKIEGKELVKAVVDSVFLRLNTVDKDVLRREISMYVEKGRFYLRLDKQAAFQGVVKLGAADPIHLRIRFRKGKIEEIVKICEELGIFA